MIHHGQTPSGDLENQSKKEEVPITPAIGDNEMELPTVEEEEKQKLLIEEEDDSKRVDRNLLYDKQRRSMSMLQPSEKQQLDKLLVKDAYVDVEEKNRILFEDHMNEEQK